MFMVITLLVIALLGYGIYRIIQKGARYQPPVGTTGSGLGGGGGSGGSGGGGASGAREIIVCDSGSNAVIAFAIDPASGRLTDPPIRLIHNPPAGQPVDTQLQNPWDVCVTAGGDTYALNLNGDGRPTTITYYRSGANGAYAPDGIFANDQLSNGTALALKGNPASLLVASVSPGFTGIAEVPRDPTGSPLAGAEPDGGIIGDNDFLSGLAGIAWDNGNLLVLVTSPATNSVFIWNNFRSGALQDKPPTSTITGDGTGLSQPQRIAVDRNGKIYVTNLGNATITVYPAGANGNQAPLQLIGGGNPSATQLHRPIGIAVDDTGQIYVADSGSILVFGALANGNVAPVQVLRATAQNMLNNPTGVNFRIPS